MSKQKEEEILKNVKNILGENALVESIMLKGEKEKMEPLGKASAVRILLEKIRSTQKS